MVSPIPIRVRSTWIPRGPRGFTVHNGIRDLPELPRSDVWYPSALTDAMAERDLQPELDDMHLFFEEVAAPG